MAWFWPIILLLIRLSASFSSYDIKMLHGIWCKLENWIKRYLIQTYHRAVDGASCCTFWLSQSEHCHNMPSSPFWCWRSNIASLLCIQDITPFWRCQTGLVLILLCHCRLVDRIEENNKMVIVGLRLVSSQSKLLPTMTLYSTIILEYFRVQTKNKNIKSKKK